MYYILLLLFRLAKSEISSITVASLIVTLQLIKSAICEQSTAEPVQLSLLLLNGVSNLSGVIKVVLNFTNPSLYACVHCLLA